MRPLYLTAAGCLVEREDGALRVSVAEQADRWFPLSRLSQVISARPVTWTTEALLACAELGVSVTFVDAEGEVIARLIGQTDQRLSFAQRWDDFLNRPDWRERYAEWLRAMENMAMRSVLRRAGSVPDTFPTPAVLGRVFATSLSETIPPRQLRALDQRLQGLIVAQVTQHLASIGSGELLGGGFGPDLAGDFTRILFWDFQLARCAWIEQRRRQHLSPDVDPAAVTDFFESRRPRSERLLAALSNRLHRWLVELR